MSKVKVIEFTSYGHEFSELKGKIDDKGWLVWILAEIKGMSPGGKITLECHEMSEEEYEELENPT